MKIALIEFHIEWEDKEKNFAKAEKCLNLLKDKGVQLVLFPEMSFTGFSMQVEKTADAEEETIRRASGWSKEYGMTIGCGWVGQAGQRCGNHYSVADQGRMIADYVKIHPFSYSGEDRYFEKGDHLCVCGVGDFCLGLQICYDLRFPEVFQILSKKADIIAVPANWPQKRREHWNCLLRARAIENQVYIAGINCVGAIGGLEYSGDTQLIDPAGNVCRPAEEISSEADKIYIYEIQNNVSEIRKGFPVKQDRREELYRNLSV